MNLIAVVIVFLMLTGVPAAVAQPLDALGVRLILVRTEAEANDLVRQLQAGEQFDELARMRSIDPSSGNGGYLAGITVPQLRDEFQNALRGVTPGQFSAVTRVGQNYALLKLLTPEETRASALKAWIDAGANPRSAAVEMLWIMAIAANQPDMMKALLDAGANVNIPFGDGSTVLMGAAQRGQVDSVRTLLEVGANVNARAENGSTALLEAAYAGHSEIVSMLLQAGADVNAHLTDGSTVLMKAAQEGHTSIVSTLLAAGADANAKAGNGLTALMQASYTGHLDTVRLLLAAKADPNAQLNDGSTALMAASLSGHTEIVRALLEADADVRAGGSSGTALMEAAYAGRLDTVRVLLAAGSDANASLANGVTALMGAALGGHAETVRALIEAGAKADATDSKGWTALTHAQSSSNVATVQVLLPKFTRLSPEERSIILGRTYVNEYYSSSERTLLTLARTELQKALDANPENRTALEWMAAVEFLEWDEAPAMQQFRRVNSLLKESIRLNSDLAAPHYWIAATNWLFLNRSPDIPATDVAALLDEGIAHGRKVLELDPADADAAGYLSLLYRKKAETATVDHDQLVRLADTAHQAAVRLRAAQGNRPSRPDDQFTRPAAPPPPLLSNR